MERKIKKISSSPATCSLMGTIQVVKIARPGLVFCFFWVILFFALLKKLLLVNWFIVYCFIILTVLWPELMQCFSLCSCCALACAFALKAKANVFVMYWVGGDL